MTSFSFESLIARSEATKQPLAPSHNLIPCPSLRGAKQRSNPSPPVTTSFHVPHCEEQSDEATLRPQSQPHSVSLIARSEATKQPFAPSHNLIPCPSLREAKRRSNPSPPVTTSFHVPHCEKRSDEATPRPQSQPHSVSLIARSEATKQPLNLITNNP
jgi:hypothetical protein